MAWGKAASAKPEETASQLLAKASSTGSLVVMPFRKFGDAEVVALTSLLIANATITELKASGHPLGTEGAAALGKLISSERCALRRLAVGDANFGGAGLRALLSGLDESSSGSQCHLQALDLGLKGLQSADVDALLHRCIALRECLLGRNPLGAMGVAALIASGCFALPLGSTLIFLDLSEAGIDGATVGALATAVEQDSALCALQTLHLSSNPAIGDHLGGKALARLLGSLTALRCMHLQRCGLGVEAANALGGALSLAVKLRELRLDENPTLFFLADPTDDEEGGEEEEDAGIEPPASFIESALPTRSEYDASLKLPPTERLARERAAAAAQRASATALDGSALVAGLGACLQLSILGVGSCGLRDTSACALARHRRHGDHHLSEIDARANELGVVGASALLGIPGLARLTLFHNPSLGSDDSAQGGAQHSALARGLEPAAELTSLDLGACALRVETLRSVCAVLKSDTAPNLRCLELFGNGDESTRDEWLRELDGLRESRAELDVAWKEPSAESPAARA
jgi:hypothetical protein